MAVPDDPPTDGTAVRLLGPVALTVRGTPVDLGTPKQRAVFAALAVCAGQVVSGDHVLMELWGADAPPSARSTLQVYVSRLRRGLTDAAGPVLADDPGTPRVLLRAPGYLLDVQDDAVDAFRLRRLVTAARRSVDTDPAAALGLADRALALVTGAPLSDVVDLLGPATATEVARLDELVLLARETRLSALLGTGDAATAAAEAAALALQQPLREQVSALQVLALYRAGRQAEALEAYERLRRALLEEHGVDPGGALRQLHASVLQQDPALEADVVPRARAGPPRTGRSVPAPLTSFVGRRSDVRRLTELVAGHRLVTVTGIGGTGKTRLAVEVAAAHAADDGPVWVDLAPVREPEVLLDAVAAGLGVVVDGTPALVAALARRELLVVLDNGEQVLDALADLVSALLAGCPGVRVLATSRVALDVDGEVVLELAPLAVDDAVALFVERARAASPSWAQDDTDGAAIARICRELDGLPLAVELAAQHCRTLSPDRIAAELGDRFALLRTAPGGSRVRSAGRQRGASVEAAIAWSVDRLSSAGVDGFRSAAVFEGGFDLDALSAVAGPGSALPVLLELVEAGLVGVVRAPGGRRYRVLATVREYATRHTPPAQWAAVQRAHLAWFAAVADDLGPRLRGPDASWAFERVTVELPNARTALTTALEQGDGTAARLIAGELGWFWFRRALVAEGLRWSLAALAAPPDEPVDAARSRAGVSRARAELTAATLAYLAGDLGLLELHGTRAVEGAELAGDSTTLGLALATLSYQHAYRGRVDEARAASDRAERTAREHGPPWALGDVLALRAQLLRALGDLEGALRLLDESILVTVSAGHVWGQVSALWMSGKVELDLGRPGQAAVRARSAVEALAEDGDVSSWLVVLQLLAGAVARLGDGARGAVLLGAVDAVAERTGFFPHLMDPLDSPRNVTAVREALSPEVFEERHRAGGELDRDDVLALVRRLDLVAPA